MEGDATLRESAVYAATILGSVPQLERALKAEEEVNWQDAIGLAPLHHACRNGYLDVAEMLINYGAKVDMLDTAGMPSNRMC